MHGTSTRPLIAAFVLAALAAVNLAPATPGQETGTPTTAHTTTGSDASGAPIVLAQGRCFNGHCF